MKYVIGAVCFFLFCMGFCVSKAESLPFDQVLNTLSTKELEEIFEQVTKQATLKDTLLKISKGELLINSENLLKTLASLLFKEILSVLKRLPFFIVPTVLFSLLSTFHVFSKNASHTFVLHIACYLFFATIMVKDMGAHVQLCKKMIEDLSKVMQALFPLLLTLLTAISSSSALALGPQATFSSAFMTAVLTGVTMKSALCYSNLVILKSVSPSIKIDHLTELFKKMTAWTLGVSFTVFIGVTALQSVHLGITNGIGMRTAKYAVDHFVPVVGGMFADTMDTLIGCSLLIKNALGITGFMLLLSFSISPLVKTLALVFLYKGVAALLEPIGEKKFVESFNAFSSAMTLFLIIMLSALFMFILIVAQLLVLGNVMVSYL